MGFFNNFLGIHSICVDNTAALSRSFYGSKLVYLYMVTYVMEDWDKYLKEIEGISSAVSNFTVSQTLFSNSGTFCISGATEFTPGI